MQNYEQIRARNALAAATDREHYDFAGRNDGKAVAKKVPAQIIQNGFLGALAFACEEKQVKTEQREQIKPKDKLKNPGHHAVFRAIIAHLPTVHADFGIGNVEPKLFLERLAKHQDAGALRAVTAESLAYLNYLRRFAQGDEESENE